MWIKMIGNIKYGYDTYLEALENRNGYAVVLVGIMYQKDLLD